MAVTVKKAMLWRTEVDNRPGMLASTLQPLAEAGADLQVVMAYRYPGGEDKAAIEVHPVSGRKPNAAARKAGLTPSPIPVLLVEGDNRPGLGHAIAKALGEAGINLSFVMAQVVGRKYAAVFGFENQADANQAATLIKKSRPPGARNDLFQLSVGRVGGTKPEAVLFRRFVSLGISRRPEVAERRAANDQWRRTREMRLERYFVGAFIIGVLVVIIGGNFFEIEPLFAAALSAAYVLLVVYGGCLKYRQAN